MSDEISTVAMKWQEELARNGYEKRLENRKDVIRLSRFSRTWKIIFKTIKLKPCASVFELGCGGGKQLIPMALGGYKCSGIDCSAEVLHRCKDLMSDVERLSGKPLDVQLIHGDFLAFSAQDSYDLVFNFGVIEHFIDDHERETAIRKMFSICKPGGYVVSVVPNGQHPLRERMRKDGLGGYRVPEIDYNSALMVDEMRKAGAREVRVIPHDLFGYLWIDHTCSAYRKTIYHCIYYIAQLFPRVQSGVTRKHAASLICIAKRAS
jgi:SAM-dependent methyltransferase